MENKQIAYKGISGETGFVAHLVLCLVKRDNIKAEVCVCVCEFNN